MGQGWRFSNKKECLEMHPHFSVVPTSLGNRSKKAQSRQELESQQVKRARFGRSQFEHKKKKQE